MTRTEQVYGGSLYSLAAEEGLTHQLLEQLKQVMEILAQEPRYMEFLSTISIAKQERCGALEEAFGGRVHPYLLSFMKLLTENGTIGQLEGCAGEFRRLYNRDNGIVEVQAVTAVELSQQLRESLHQKLEKVLEKKVELRCSVDPACMGGVLLELPGRQVDGTVKSRLNSLSRSLKTNVL